MDSFESIIAALLKDITGAQDQANKYSVKISADYQANSALAVFGVPNAVVRSFEITLKFGLDKLSPSRPEGTKLVSEFDPELNAGFASAIQSIYEEICANEAFRKFVGPVVWEQWLRQRDLICELLFLALIAKLQSIHDDFLKGDRQQFAAVLADEVLDRLATIWQSYDVDLKEHSGQVEELREHMASIINRSIPKRLLDLTRQDSGLDIQYDLKVLEAIDTNKLATVTLKVDMRNYDWATFKEKDIGTNYSGLFER